MASCDRCGTPYAVKKPWQRFCSPYCRYADRKQADYHRACPSCGQRMWRTSSLCEVCAAKPTPSYMQVAQLPPPAHERLVAERVVTPEGCWESPSRKGQRRGGYVRVYVTATDGPLSFFAHRLMYEAFVGPIPAGLSIDHLCRNSRCYNPAHLEPVTRSVNTYRGIAARRAV